MLLACSLGTVCAFATLKHLSNHAFGLMVGCALLVLGALFVVFVAWSNGDEGPASTLQAGTRAVQ